MLCKLITDVFQRDSKLQAMLPQLRNTRFTKITDSVLLPENDFILPFFHSFILHNIMFRNIHSVVKNFFYCHSIKNFSTDTLFVIFNIIERIIK